MNPVFWTFDHALSLKIAGAACIFLMTLLAGWIPLRQHFKFARTEHFPAAEALASGVFLGASLLHMLPHAAERFAALHYTYPMPFLLAAIIFLFLLWLEHIGTEAVTHPHGHSALKTPKATLTLFSLIMLSVHSLLAGTALGSSMTTEAAAVLVLAILAHKWAASFAFAVQLTQSTFNSRNAMILFLVFALMSPIGILFGVHFTHLKDAPLTEAITTSLAAGTFLYIGTLHGLDRAVMIHKCCNLREFSLMVLGFLLMALLALWV